MKIYFRSSGEGRNFESIASSPAAKKFLQKYGIEFEDYGTELRIPKDISIEVALTSLETLQVFCITNSARLELNGYDGEISFYHEVD